MMFEIKPMDAELYRRQTRRNTLIIALVFIALAMLLSTLAVQLFGQPGGDNLRCNIAGVLSGLLLTVLLVRYQWWPQPWMAASVYGWQLKRSLMSITNVMHQVTAGVQVNDPTAMKLLRFYHLGLTQMHELDGNSSAQGQMTEEIDAHRTQMQALGLDVEQSRLDTDWLAALKSLSA